MLRNLKVALLNFAHIAFALLYTVKQNLLNVNINVQQSYKILRNWLVFSGPPCRFSRIYFAKKPTRSYAPHLRSGTSKSSKSKLIFSPSSFSRSTQSPEQHWYECVSVVAFPGLNKRIVVGTISLLSSSSPVVIIAGPPMARHAMVADVGRSVRPSVRCPSHGYNMSKITSLKLVCLAVRKIWRTMYVSYK